MIKTIVILLCLLVAKLQSQDFTKQEITIAEDLIGDLYQPKKGKAKVLIIQIPGSGIPDRNGNSPGMENNSLKFLAESLASEHAVFAFDKRVISQMKAKKEIKEEEMTFQDNVKDLEIIIDYFKKEKKFSKIVLIGHSEGSLVAMLAANKTNGYISLAGAGRSIDFILKDQLLAQAPFWKEEIELGLNTLKSQQPYENKNQMLESIFRKSVQAYMMSWMQIDPEVEIKKLQVPILIINGTKDIQVKENEAEILHQAKPDATLVILENMNHVLKNIHGDLGENYKSYTDPNMPLHPELSKVILDFITKNVK